MNIEEVREIIIALKNKLMEKHLMSKKVAEVEKVLQKMNNTTNKITTEMNNRMDGLNRDWQERLRNQNAKCRNDMFATHKYCNSSKLREVSSSCDVDDVLYQTKQHLLEITDRLASIKKIEHKLAEIIEVLKRTPYNRSKAITDNIAGKTTRHIQKDNFSNTPNFYGVVEIIEIYSMCLRSLEGAIKSLESIKQMSALFNISAEGMPNIRDVNHTADVLNQFVNKLKFSMHKCNLRINDNIFFD
ncbi:Gastrulation-defective protein [Dirofilaria immitis]